MSRHEFWDDGKTEDLIVEALQDLRVKVKAEYDAINPVTQVDRDRMNRLQEKFILAEFTIREMDE